VGYATLAKARFLELRKTPEQYRRKFERDAAILEEHTRAHPKDPRWFYYLGDALHGLGRHEEAVAAFTACSALRGWDEEAAWARYRAAECLCALGRWDDAVDACALGLARHAGVAELAWLAGFASYRAGKNAQAVWWSRASIALGCFRGCGADVKRIGFRNPGALWEGPYDVLRYALKALGDEAGAAEAELDHGRAMAARLEREAAR
jgi:tetratricopeptide (TPR) repeat protein